MIIDYDHNQGLTIDQKLQSLKESVQMALDEIRIELQKSIETRLKSGGASAKDYIVEQGTSGIWQYRKWNSGRTEAWCHYPITGSIAINTASSAYGGYRSGTINLTIPSGIFTATPTAIVQKAQAQGAWLCYERVTSATNIEIMLGSGTSQTLTSQYFSVYAWT